MKGRKPKPTEVKALEGNPGKRPLPEPVRIGDPVAPDPPDDLPPEAVEFWNDTVRLLGEAGVIHSADRSALIALSVQWARAERARKVLAEEGYFALGSMGQIVEHPALAVERQAHSMFLRFAEHYGLTAVARARIGLVNQKRRTLASDMAAKIGPSPRSA